ncbi:thioesterase family protein [Actinomycetospora atypica]|uniref:Thioesterase family protein n=1 Tax=Actinomycetospora atypica TaxID=1290095 RepID=A0ABV9YVX5_9PSEU
MTHTVTDDDTAKALGSGDVPVLGTPRLIAWLEAATVEAAKPKLADGQTTVGTAVRVKHRRPTRIGGTIDVTVKLTSGPDEKGRLGFSVKAVDGDGATVADGEIDRVVVERLGAFRS